MTASAPPTGLLPAAPLGWAAADDFSPKALGTDEPLTTVMGEPASSLFGRLMQDEWPEGEELGAGVETNPGEEGKSEAPRSEAWMDRLVGAWAPAMGGPASAGGAPEEAGARPALGIPEPAPSALAGIGLGAEDSTAAQAHEAPGGEPGVLEMLRGTGLWAGVERQGPAGVGKENGGNAGLSLYWNPIVAPAAGRAAELSSGEPGTRRPGQEARIGPSSADETAKLPPSPVAEEFNPVESLAALSAEQGDREPAGEQQRQGWPGQAAGPNSVSAAVAAEARPGIPAAEPIGPSVRVAERSGASSTVVDGHAGGDTTAGASGPEAERTPRRDRLGGATSSPSPSSPFSGVGTYQKDQLEGAGRTWRKLEAGEAVANSRSEGMERAPAAQLRGWAPIGAPGGRSIESPSNPDTPSKTAAGGATLAPAQSVEKAKSQDEVAPGSEEAPRPAAPQFATGAAALFAERPIRVQDRYRAAPGPAATLAYGTWDQAARRAGAALPATRAGVQAGEHLPNGHSGAAGLDLEIDPAGARRPGWEGELAFAGRLAAQWEAGNTPAPQEQTVAAKRFADAQAAVSDSGPNAGPKLHPEARLAPAGPAQSAFAAVPLTVRTEETRLTPAGIAERTAGWMAEGSPAGRAAAGESRQGGPAQPPVGAANAAEGGKERPLKPEQPSGAAVEAGVRPGAVWPAAQPPGSGAVGLGERAAPERGAPQGGMEAGDVRAAGHGAEHEPVAAGSVPLRELRFRIAEAGRRAGVEVRLDNGGQEVRVAVRTPQPELTEALRGGLHDLAARLAERGYEAQLWRPGSSAVGTEAIRLRGPEPPAGGMEGGADPGSRQQGREPWEGGGEQRQRDPWAWTEVWKEQERGVRFLRGFER